MVDLLEAQAQSQRGFYRTIAGGSQDARVVEVAAGVQATVVPIRPWFSIFNAVVYEDREALRAGLPSLRDLYAEAGVGAWSVWVRPGDVEAARILEGAGHVEEGSPLAMGAVLEELDLRSRQHVKLSPVATWTDVARCNDEAHGVLPEYTMAAALEGIADEASRVYAAGDGERPAAALVARRSSGDCYFWFVATVPAMQRSGLGAELMRTALRDALAAGCVTATLESTAAGERLYASLGFAPLGRCSRLTHYASGEATESGT